MHRSYLEKLPEFMRESVRMVEQTRDQRVARVIAGEQFLALPLPARRGWLEDYHPDYHPESQRKLAVGPSAGEVVPVELANLLEAWPRPAVQGLMGKPLVPEITTDILVIGGGGAGTAAAIAAAESGARVTLVTKLRPGDSNTIMAEGGIQVADQECDSPVQHFLDVMGGGHFTNVPDLVEALVIDGPPVLAWLEELGMLFDKYLTGRMKVRHGGGTSRKRLHSSGDVTGLELMRVLKDHAESIGTIQFLGFMPAVELLTDDSGRAVGAVLERLPGSGVVVVQAKAVILATGGFGRLHLQNFPTSNHYGATADGLVIGYRAGLPLRDLQYSQYHPTGVVYPEQKAGLLLTEKFRGLGAQLLNRHGDEFVYSLEPRDVTTAAIIRECSEYANGVTTPGGGVGVWLDVPLIDRIHGPGTIERELPGKFREFLRHGIDVRQVPLLTYPTLHYQNGGIAIQPDGGTDMPGLYAAGEVTGGVHGHNRLMGNALLDILVFGLRAGRAAAHFATTMKPGGVPGLGHVEVFQEALREQRIGTDRVAPVLLPRYQ